MTSPHLPAEPCPLCERTGDVVVRKLLMLDPPREGPPSSRRAVCPCRGTSVDDLRPEFATGTQFVLGLFCVACGIGFVPEQMAKPAPPAYVLHAEGLRRVHPDGSLGPVLQRMVDDLEP